MDFTGAIVEDSKYKKWKIGRLLGKGIYGQVFLASDDIVKEVPDDAQYAIKIGKISGSVSCELRVYSNLWNDEFVRKWKNEMGLKNIGVPHIYGSGYSPRNKICFIILQRLGPDLSCLEACGRLSIGEISIQLLNILEYIHIHGYVHDDIKDNNILFGFESHDRNQIYLVDFGLSFVYRYSDGIHNEYEEYPFLRGANDVASRDSHIGAYSRRSDIESLAFNIIVWSGGILPWMDFDDEAKVVALKREMMGQIPLFLEKCYPNGIPQGIGIFMEHVAMLGFEERPYYMIFKNMIRDELEKENAPMERCIWKYLPFEEDLKAEKERKKKNLERSWFPFRFLETSKMYLRLFSNNIKCIRVEFIIYIFFIFLSFWYLFCF